MTYNNMINKLKQLFSLKKKDCNTSSEVFFVRKFGTQEFIQSSINPLNQNILLIKKTKDSQKCFCPQHYKWEPVSTMKDSSINTYSCELNGTPFIYKAKESSGCSQYITPFRGGAIYGQVQREEISITELSPEELKKYLNDYRKYLDYKKKKSLLNENDDVHEIEDIPSDIIFYHIIFDNEKSILNLKQYFINRSMLEREFPYINFDIKELPISVFSEQYDLLNGDYEMPQHPNKKITQTTKGIYYPENIYNYCESLIKNQICKILNKSIYFADYTPKLQQYSEYYLSLQNENKTTYLGKKLQALTYYPYEPCLYFAINLDINQEEEKNPHEKKYHFDPNCYQNYCNSLGFSSFKTLKKMFYKDQAVLINYKELLYTGFKDINLITQILKTENLEFFLHQNLENIKFFTDWVIPLKGEKSTWRLLEKGFETNEYRSRFGSIHDSLYMFRTYFNNLDYEVRRSILKDGFTKYNHDLLSNISRKVKEENADFVYTEHEKSLEDEIDDYSFKLPKDYYQLVDVATTLHNCAASYKHRILDKKTLVIYAAKNNKYTLCIEVRGNVIHQQRADRNSTPIGEDYDVLKKWRSKHNLLFHGNYF